jgi:hypothetical protein
MLIFNTILMKKNKWYRLPEIFQQNRLHQNDYNAKTFQRLNNLTQLYKYRGAYCSGKLFQL